MLARLAKDTSVYGLSLFLTRCVQFLVFPIIAHFISVRDFGQLALLMSLIPALSLLINCGINNAASRYYWDASADENERVKIVSSGFWALVGFSIVGLVLGVLITSVFFEVSSIKGMVLKEYAVISVIFLIISTQWSSYFLDILRLQFSPFKYIVLAIQSSVLTAACGLFAVIYLHKGINGLVLFQAVAGFASIPLGAYFIRKDLKFFVDIYWMRKILKFGYPFILAGAGYWVFSSVDRWILVYFASSEQVGLYSIAFRFASVVFLFATAFGQAWSPLAIKWKADYPDTYRKRYGDVLLLLLYVMVVIGGGVSLFSGELIYTFLPVSYIKSSMALSILCWAAIVQATQQITSLGISLEEKTTLMSKGVWLSVLVNIVANVILIYFYGLIGAAISMVITYLFLTLFYYYYTQRLHSITIDYKIFFWLLSAIVAMIIISTVYHENKIKLEIIGFKLMFYLMILVAGLIYYIQNRKFVKEDFGGVSNEA
jgi:O-antigen/teichoic acid export membrane protein